MKPIFSIIIPTYNDVTYLKESVDSVLNQYFPKNKYEIIIVDGSINDHVFNFYMTHLSKNKQIRYIRKNCNLPEALNIGIKNMHGILFKQLDSDDMLSTPFSLVKYYKYASLHPDYLIFYSDANIINPAGELVRISKEKQYEGLSLARRVWNGPIGYPSAYLINKKAFQLVGLFNEKNLQAEDWEWRIRAVFINKLKFYHIPEPLISYRIHRKQKSTLEMRTNSFYLFRIKKKLIKEIKTKIEDREMLNILKVSLIKAIISYIKKNIELTLKLNDNMTYKKLIKHIEEKIGSV
ncbi:MAG: glycosyltransferase [Candidatus Micrarchaeaceae archaeon]